MWKRIYDLAKLVLSYGQQLHHHQSSIETLENEMKQVTAAVNQLYFEMRSLRDEFRHTQSNEQKERENLVLRLENQMLKFERRFPHQ